MRQLLAKVLLVCALLLPAGVFAAPLGHAHNDYEHARPLQDALEQGFASVEADIWLRDGQLLIGHDEADLSPDRTLASLYLEPLRKAAEAGTLEPIVLLVDIKSEGEPTYRALSEVLEPYKDMLAHVSEGQRRPGPVEVIVSGNRPRESMEGESSRLAFFDGRLTDLDAGLAPDFMPLVSDNWTRHFSWTGAGDMPAAELSKLKDIVRSAHEKGYRVRFWATPDAPGPDRDALWGVLSEAGVDYINTDDLAGFAAFKAERG